MPEKIEKTILNSLRRALGKDTPVRPEALGPQKTPKYMRLGRPQVAVPKNQPLPQLLPPAPAEEMMLPPPIMGAGGVAAPPPVDPMGMMSTPSPLGALAPAQAALEAEPNPFDLYANSGGS